MLIVHHVGQVVAVVVPVLLVVLVIQVHQTLVMVEQVFKLQLLVQTQPHLLVLEH